VVDVFSMVQEAPFQPSISAYQGPAVVVVLVPTNVQLAVDVHDRADGVTCDDPEGTGSRACSAHALPFHWSVNAVPPDIPLPPDIPATSQNVADVHETVSRRSSVLPAGPGTDCAAQDVPFQVAATPGPGCSESFGATASQKVTETQDTDV
jgi:hypothetical protein